MATSRAPANHNGFTLIEAVVAITILGVLSAVVAVFVNAPLQGYFATANRALLTDAADGALRRISREVGSALPNSIRLTSAGDPGCFEFLPVVAGGRYRYQTGATGNGDILDFTIQDPSFDVLGQINLANLPTGATYNVAIYNLGIGGSDAYAGAGASDYTTAPISNATTSNITLSAKNQFPFPSPNKTFSVIQNYSVVYSYSGTTLYRTTRAIPSTKMTSCPTTGIPVVSHVSSCNFYYLPAVNERNGILAMTLGLTLNNETITLYDQVMINNAP
jgi:MSHA biogenesis protein MshO